MNAMASIWADLENLSRDSHCGDARAMAVEMLDLLTPPEDISTTDCAARYRYIPDAEGLGASLWSPTLTPYVNGIQDTLDDPRTNLVIVPKPGRVGGTVAAENLLFKRLKFGPRTDTLWYLGSDSEMDAYIDRTVRKFFELHPDIQDMVGKGRSDDKRNFKRIMGRILEYLQVNNKTITGRTGGFIVGDEIDSINPRLRATFVDQCFIRGTTLGSRFKAYLCSHMDAGWTSGIASAWKESSRGIWYWPCPDCGGFSSPCPTAPRGWRTTLEFERPTGVSDDDLFEHVARTAGLACPHCGSVIENKAKEAMNAAGVWVHEGQSIALDGTVTGEPKNRKVMGFWIHGTMSPWVSWGDLARRYVSALIHYERTRKPERLKEVSAKVLGEVYEGGAQYGSLSPEKLAARARGSFEVGTVPDEVLFVTAAVDIGGSKFDVGFWGWDLEGRSWLIDRVTLKQRRWAGGRMRDLRPAERIEDWQILVDEVIDRKLPLASDPEKGLPVAVVFIDVGDGHVTKNGREFAYRMAGKKWGNFPRVKLLRGSTVATSPELPVRPTEVSKDEQGNPLPYSVLEWRLGVTRLKTLAVERLAVSDGGPGQCYFADGLPRSCFAEFTGEVLIDGKWERRGPNETLDCFAYAEAARQTLKPDRPDINWTRSKPVWATPVPIASKGGDLAVAGEGPDGPLEPPKKKASILDRFDQLNRR